MIRIIESNMMVKSITVNSLLKLSMYERFIKPILHPVTTPFEPWIKTRDVIRIVQVPRTDVLVIPGTRTIVAHPITAQMIRNEFRKEVVL